MIELARVYLGPPANGGVFDPQSVGLKQMPIVEQERQGGWPKTPVGDDSSLPSSGILSHFEIWTGFELLLSWRAHISETIVLEVDSLQLVRERLSDVAGRRVRLPGLLLEPGTQLNVDHSSEMPTFTPFLLNILGWRVHEHDVDELVHRADQAGVPFLLVAGPGDLVRAARRHLLEQSP